MSSTSDGRAHPPGLRPLRARRQTPTTDNCTEVIPRLPAETGGRANDPKVHPARTASLARASHMGGAPQRLWCLHDPRITSCKPDGSLRPGALCKGHWSLGTSTEVSGLATGLSISKSPRCSVRKGRRSSLGSLDPGRNDALRESLDGERLGRPEGPAERRRQSSTSLRHVG